MSGPLPLRPGVAAGGWLAVSGQVGLEDGALPDGVRAQTAQALANLRQVVESHGAGLTDVVKTNVFLVSMEDFAVMNEEYAKVFGATVLAAATSLPELSTGLTSVRNGDYQLAVSDIFGGNAFLPVLFLLATLLSGQAVLPRAQDTDIYLTAVGALLTLVYVVGLIFRPQRRIARMGVDSLVVLLLYLLSVGGLFIIALT